MLLLTSVLYLPALDSYFVAEDLNHVTFGWSDVVAESTTVGQSTGYRPGTALYLAATNALWGRNPSGHHATAFLLHALVGWLACLVVERVTGDRLLALVAAVLFVAAPAHTEAVIWLAAAIGTVVSGLLCMIAAWLWVRTDCLPTPATVGGVAGLYFMALLVKEVAAPLPLLLVLLDWQTGRLAPKPITATRHLLRRYWPFVVVLGLYVIAYWRSGALGHAASYGVNLDASLTQLTELWAAYARDLFRPASTFLEWRMGTDNWVWLVAFLLLFYLVPAARWAAAWTLLALLPGATAYGPRLTYLSLVGFSVVIGAVLTGGVRGLLTWAGGLAWPVRPPARVLRALPIVGTGLLVTGLLVADVRAVHRDAANWVEAGKLTWSIPRQARALLPEPPPGAELFFIDLPDNVNGAYAFRWGINQEVKYVYGDRSLPVRHVIAGTSLAGKVPLESIPCEAAAPRHFFKYFQQSSQLQLVTPAEFGLVCPVDEK